MVFRSFLSPIFDYTDPAFRLLCQRHGAEAACVPLVNAEAMVRGRLPGFDALSGERNLGVQLVGSDPAALGRASRLILERMPSISWLNLNCGCPSSRTMDAGGGSALLAHPDRMIRAVKEMRRNADILISVKLRALRTPGDTLMLCRGIEMAGADFLILHGRRPEQGYRGEADWGLIGSVKEGIDMPLVGNGDISSSSEGRARVEAGLCDSYMVGRAAMSNPTLFEDGKPESLKERFGLLQEYISIHEDAIGEIELKRVKRKALNLISGVKDASSIRDAICRAASVEDIMALHA